MIIGEVTCDLLKFDFRDFQLNICVLTDKSDMKDVRVGGSNVWYGETLLVKCHSSFNL